MSNLNDFVIEDRVIKKYKGSDPDVVVPEGVEIIGERAFHNHGEIKTIYLPTGLKEIKGLSIGGAFYGCAGLRSFTLPDSVEAVGYAAFYGCSNLMEIQMPMAAISDKMFGSSGKSIIMTLTQLERAPVRVVASFRKDYWSQTWKYPKEYLLPITEEAIPVYDRLLAAGSYDGFGISEDMRIRACFWRLLDNSFPVEEELRPEIKEFLASKITKALKIAEQDNSAMYIQTLVDIGAINNENQKKVNRALAKSAIPEIQAMVDHLEPSPHSNSTSVVETTSIEPQFVARIKQINANGILMKNGVDTLPDVLQANGCGTASKDYLKLILAEYMDLIKYGPLTPAPLAEEAAEKLEKTSLQTALREVYDANSNEKQQLALMMPLFRFADGNTIRELYPQNRNTKWKETSANRALLLSDTREAMLYADKYHLLEEYASMRGTTADILRDSVLAEFGLDEKGKKTYDLGNNKVIVSMASDLTLSLFDEKEGKIVKSIPKKGTDPEKYEIAKADLAELKKNIKKVAKGRCDRLFGAFLSGEAFPAKSWKTSYTRNPVLNMVARLLVWDQRGKNFTLSNNGAIDCAEQPYDITEAPIKVAHPIEMEPEEVETWQMYFVHHGLKQPFLQIWEPVIDQETIKEDRYKDCMIPYYRFIGQEKNGIYVEDNDFHNDISIQFVDCDADVERVDFRRHEIRMEDRFEVTAFRFQVYSRHVNHIVAYLDRITVWDRVRNDDVSVMEYLDRFTLAQITEFIRVAQEAKAVNVLALLLNYKNVSFVDFDPIEEFILE